MCLLCVSVKQEFVIDMCICACMKEFKSQGSEHTSVLYPCSTKAESKRGKERICLPFYTLKVCTLMSVFDKANGGNTQALSNI